MNNDGEKFSESIGPIHFNPGIFHRCFSHYFINNNQIFSSKMAVTHNILVV